MDAMAIRDPAITEDASDELPRWRRAIPLVLGLALALTLAMLFMFARQASADREYALGRQQHSFHVMALALNAEGTAAAARYASVGI